MISANRLTQSHAAREVLLICFAPAEGGAQQSAWKGLSWVVMHLRDVMHLGEVTRAGQ